MNMTDIALRIRALLFRRQLECAPYTSIRPPSFGMNRRVSNVDSTASKAHRVMVAQQTTISE
jgi:hypothetical protein